MKVDEVRRKLLDSRGTRWWPSGVLLASILFCGAVQGQEHDHMAIWSTDDGSGEVTTNYDLANKKIQLFRSFCASGECFYSTITPAFLAPEEDTNPNDDFHVLNDGTELGIEVIAADAAITLRVNGNRLDDPGESARLGTTPGIHVHPDWQVQTPENEHGDYEISFRFTSTTLPYTNSQVFTSVLTNIEPPTMPPTPTRTPRPGTVCAGDCDGDDDVRIEELTLGLKMVIGGDESGECPALDDDSNGTVTVDELMRAVGVALHGCLQTPTPTRPPASFRRIQDEIFTPKCALPSCHVAPNGVNDLVLSDGFAYDELVGVEPFIEAAKQAGLLRVDPGNPDRSFLLIKLTGPPPVQGSRMPLAPALPLSQEEIDLVSDWIVQGAAR